MSRRSGLAAGEVGFVLLVLDALSVPKPSDPSPRATMGPAGLGLSLSLMTLSMSLVTTMCTCHLY